MKKSIARQRLLTEGWLTHVPVEFGTALLDICDWKHFAPNAPLYVAGDPPGGLFGIADGSIGYTSALGRADSPVLHVGKAVVWTGIYPLLTGKPRLATIVAAEPVLSAYADLPPLEELLARQPHWWKHIAQELLIEHIVLSSTANDLLIRSSRRRCAATLLRLADCRFAAPPAGVIAEAQITQEALAEMTNLSRSSISTLINAMVGDGHVVASYRAIRILDYEALRRIADSDW